MSFSDKERERLAALFLENGPDAPTLCEGWTTRDLAIHLLLRERKPYKIACNFVPPLKSVLDDEKAKQEQRPFEDVVEEWAGGPPVVMKPIDPVMNTGEHFIHHEDVRRGDGTLEPREFSAAVNEELMTNVKRFGALGLNKSKVPIVLTPPTLPPVTFGGKRGVAKRGDGIIRVFGEPGELLMWASGRGVADITIEGDTAALKDLNVKV